MIQKVIVFHNVFTKEMYFSTNLGQIHDASFEANIHLKVNNIGHVRRIYKGYREIANPLPRFKPVWIDNSINRQECYKN